MVRQNVREAPTGSAQVILFADSAQVVFDWGHDNAGLAPSPTRGSISGRPSEIHNWRTR